MGGQVQFKTGDIVKLKSGGPEMTIKAPASQNKANFYCQWFAGKKLEQGNFPSNSLDLVKKDK